ncbi:hypothetical protein WA026_007235 [Henosepilachna vigintioctopunctata]|uniref:NADP-dependent oxidoreductase domain-containing protein n=1 Tax=Henosepilachna vigintioctopunctata TaxID=420089 RepID=A0AAW1UU84_9CUCU
MPRNTRARPSLSLCGTSIPAMGLGLYRPIDTQTLSIALKHGYRHFNTAFHYRIGERQRGTIAKWFEDNIVQRDDLFFTADIHVVLTTMALDIATVHPPYGDYVDLCLLHLPDYTKDISSTEKKFETQCLPVTDGILMTWWKKVEELHMAKKARFIGLANFSAEQINFILHNAEIKPSVVQIAFHPHFQNNDIISLCERNGILVSAYQPIPASTLVDFLNNTENDVLITQDPTLNVLATCHNKTPLQIALRYAYQRNMAVTTTTTSAEQLIQNMQIFDFTLTREDMETLRNLDNANKVDDANNGNT